jgi:hypothetical protein
VPVLSESVYLFEVRRSETRPGSMEVEIEDSYELNPGVELHEA